MQLATWQKERQAEIEGIKGRNNQENADKKKLAEEAKSNANPWVKVTENCELNSSKYVGEKDVTRMRQAMIARKNDLSK